MKRHITAEAALVLLLGFLLYCSHSSEQVRARQTLATLSATAQSLDRGIADWYAQRAKETLAALAEPGGTVGDYNTAMHDADAFVDRWSGLYEEYRKAEAAAVAILAAQEAGHGHDSESALQALSEATARLVAAAKEPRP